MGLGDFKFGKEVTDQSRELQEEASKQDLFTSLLSTIASLGVMAIPGFQTMGLAAKGGLSSLFSLIGSSIGREVGAIDKDKYTLVGNALEELDDEMRTKMWTSAFTSGISPIIQGAWADGFKGNIFQSEAKKRYKDVFKHMKGTDLYKESLRQVKPKFLNQAPVTIPGASIDISNPDKLSRRDMREIKITLDEKGELVTDKRGNILLEGDAAKKYIDEGLIPGKDYIESVGPELTSDMIPVESPIELPIKDLGLEKDMLEELGDVVSEPNKSKYLKYKSKDWTPVKETWYDAKEAKKYGWDSKSNRWTSSANTNELLEDKLMKDWTFDEFPTNKV